MVSVLYPRMVYVIVYSIFLAVGLVSIRFEYYLSPHTINRLELCIE